MFVDPISLAIVAGVTSLGAGVVKFLKDYLREKMSTSLITKTEVTIQNGEKKIVVSGLSDEELKKVLDNFKAEVGTKEAAVPKAPAS
jgi:ribosomal protein L12E/L44/L45/RPP1/RPP2